MNMSELKEEYHQRGIWKDVVSALSSVKMNKLRSKYKNIGMMS